MYRIHQRGRPALRSRKPATRDVQDGDVDREDEVEQRQAPLLRPWDRHVGRGSEALGADDPSRRYQTTSAVAWISGI